MKRDCIFDCIPVTKKKCLMYEYSSAANPSIDDIPIKTFGSKLYNTGRTHARKLDISMDLNTIYSATTPNLLANFIEINKEEILVTKEKSTSNLFYVIKGRGRTVVGKKVISWKEGDVFVIPSYKEIKHFAFFKSALYWINDSPLLKYLGVSPKKKNFNITKFRKEDYLAKISEIIREPDSLNKNRLGVLLGNKFTENSTKTITPTLWSLVNVITPYVIQKPHRHNSVALDLCISARPGVYTLIGKDLNEDGTIKNPVRCDWQSGTVFITPPGLWHSHHNETDEPAWVLPIQDAGLHTYMRTLDIQFSV